MGGTGRLVVEAQKASPAALGGGLQVVGGREGKGGGALARGRKAGRKVDGNWDGNGDGVLD